MKNKEFREIQVSSSLLVVIFLGVLALGVFIFLLGISVGKKQVRITSQTQVVTQQIPEPVKEARVEPPPAETEAAKTEAPRTDARAGKTPSQPPAGAALASKTPIKTTAERPKTTAPKAPAGGSGLYYVQVAATTDKAQAAALADRYRKQGYTAVVTDPRPTDTKTWYRVRLGGYASRDRAVDLLAKLNAAAGKRTDYRVVQD
jgi:cell division septation protein DedD